MAAIKITQKVIIVHGKSDPYDGRTVKIKMVNGGYLGAHFWYDKDKRDNVSAYLYSHNSIGCGNTWKIKKQGNGYIFQIVKGHHGTVPVHHYLSCEAYFGKMLVVDLFIVQHINGMDVLQYLVLINMVIIRINLH